MMRIRPIVSVLCALVLVALAAGSQAQVRQKESTNTAVTGQIMAIDSAKTTITVEGANKDGGTYLVNDKTTIMDNSNKAIGLANLKKGWRVIVTADTGEGKNVATYIEVVDAP